MEEWKLKKEKALHGCSNFLPSRKELDLLKAGITSGEKSCRGVYNGEYMYPKFEFIPLFETDLEEPKNQNKKSEWDEFWRAAYDYQMSKELQLQREHKGWKKCKVFEYEDELSYLEQRRFIAKFEEKGALGEDLSSKKGNEYFLVAPDFHMGFLDWLACCLKYFLEKFPEAEDQTWENWYTMMENSIRVISLALFRFLYEKKKYIHGNLPYGLAITLSGNLDFLNKKKLEFPQSRPLPQVIKVQFCNAAIKRSLLDIDVADVGKMFMMMLLGGNPENMEALRGDEGISAGKEPLFPEAEEKLSHALRNLCERLKHEVPARFDPDYDYVYRLINHPALWLDVQMYRFLYEFDEIVLVRMPNKLVNWIKSKVNWEHGSPISASSSQTTFNVSYSQGHATHWVRNVVVQPNEKFKKGEPGAQYTEPERLAAAFFKDFRHAMDLHDAIGEIIDRREYVSRLGPGYSSNGIRRILTDEDRDVVRERLEAYLYFKYQIGGRW